MKKIDAHALMSVFRLHKPIIWDGEDNGYDKGAMDMWNLLYAAVRSAPVIHEKEGGNEQEEA